MAPIHINIYNRSRSPRSRSRRRRRRRSSSTPRRSRRASRDRRIQLSLEDVPRPPMNWVGPYQLPAQQEAPPRDWRGPSAASQRSGLANSVPPYATALPVPSTMPPAVAAPDVNQFFATQTTIQSYATSLANPYGLVLL